jgi:hypothetical protein
LRLAIRRAFFIVVANLAPRSQGDVMKRNAGELTKYIAGIIAERWIRGGKPAAVGKSKGGNGKKQIVRRSP